MSTGHHSHDHWQPMPIAADPAHARLMRMATYFSVSVASILILAKLVAWLMTDSVSMLSTLVDSLLDAGASLINLFAVRHALEPADSEHRFGHGKAEPLAGLAQAAFIGGSAVFLLFQATERLFVPRQLVNADLGIMVMGLSVALTLALVLFQRMVIRKTKSVAISADSLHYQGDLLINISVIVALVLGSRFSMGWADPVFAYGIAAYILWSAYQIVRDSLDLLMDRELPESDRQLIKEIAESHEGVVGLHDMRTRSTGAYRFIQFHLEMDGQITLREAHDISERVMYDIEAKFPNTEVLIHEDPAGVPERRMVFK